VLFGLVPASCLLIVGVSTFSFTILEIAKSTVVSGAADVVVAAGLAVLTVIACTSCARALPSTLRSPMARD
jgi:hypothetical protein